MFPGRIQEDPGVIIAVFSFIFNTRSIDISKTYFDRDTFVDSKVDESKVLAIVVA